MAAASRRWHHKPELHTEPLGSCVHLNESDRVTGHQSSPAMSSVAIIGGGVAGLACAKRLGTLGISATVFDTGKHGPGGRASSRMWRDHVVDHAAQFVVTTDPAFSKAIATSGAAKRFGKDGRFGTLGKYGYTPIVDAVDRWVGVEGMGSIVRELAKDLDVKQNVWVPPSNGLRYRAQGGWSVVVPGEHGKRGLEHFDAAVIAHNGKCADRLTSNIPARELHALVRTNFAANLPRLSAPGSGTFTLNQIYSLLVEMPKGVMPDNFDAAFVEDEPSLRWLSSNTGKFGHAENSPDIEAWTVLSSASFAKQHKVPQENIPVAKEREVTALLLQAVERLVGLSVGALSGKESCVSATKLQLWGAALPINRWASNDGADFVWAAKHNIGVAGDWLSASPERASTIEAAWLSGVRLAEHMARGGPDVGLQLGEDGGAFVPVNGDFGAGGSAVSAWVAAPAEDMAGSANGDGYGRPKGGKDGGRRGGKATGKAAGKAASLANGKGGEGGWLNGNGWEGGWSSGHSWESSRGGWSGRLSGAW